MTLEQWAELPEEESGELIDGFLLEEEVPDPVHELAVAWLVVLFGNWLRGKGGFVFGSEVKLRISQERGRKADVVVYLPGRPPPPRRGLLTEPPDVVVEVVTPTPRDERRDRVEKMNDYAALGARFYWLLDPALGSLEIFQVSEQGRYAKVVGATAGSIEPVPGCAGLSLDLDELWRELDRLGPDD
ncbi:MAG: Uma2 family endonuclease [Myxococcales bacterium]|nr:Uma2 family endonuclease [Myxococcales bacterium]MCB9583296.1 Uma2 family endonuclease [Polyangiaceae bacterium]